MNLDRYKIAGIVLTLFLFNMSNILNGQDKKTNVVFILADDLGWKDLSYQGSEVLETPNIDKLAEEGMNFSQAYTVHPRCVPARYGLITGRYPARVQLPGGKWKWTGSEYTIAEAFQDNGYKTFFTGKWHLTRKDQNNPEDEGFGINIAGGYPGAPQSYFYPYNTGRGKEKNILDLVEGGKEGEYLPDRLTDETIKFIKENKDDPFFVYLSHYSVHTPFEAKKELVEYYKKKIDSYKFDGEEFVTEGTGYTKRWQNNAVYAAMIHSLDESVGRVMVELEKLGLDKNTIIVFTSDHGGLSNKGYNYRPLATSNLPLRAGKGHCYEGGVRVPLIVKWPNNISTKSKSDEIITGVDIHPTLIEAAGLKIKSYDCDGKSFLATLKGGEQDNENRPIFWHSPLSRPHSTGDINVSAVRIGDYKLLDFYDARRIELYNISEDIGETKNLAETEPEKTKELQQILNKWKKSVSAIKVKPK
ncbi:MAG: sulfatase [Melioribacteraceae bacterium]|nr:sulfatase [Melioribacteraceae bacterium]